MPLKRGRRKATGPSLPLGKRSVGEKISLQKQQKQQQRYHHTPEREPGQVLVMGQGDVGQLGLGEDVTEVKRPRVMTSLQEYRVVQVACGGMHTAALTDSGKVYTWGCNDEGALGRAAGSEAFSPGLVQGELDTRTVVQISAGDSHTAALTDDEDVWAWGVFRDSSGPFGLVEANVPATSPAWVASDGSKIASGSDHMAILTSTRNVLTLGSAEQGQLGRVHHMFSYRGGRKGVQYLLTPQMIRCQKPRHAPKPKFVDIFCGLCNTFALTEDSAIYVWGLNNYGQLGTADKSSCFQPQRLPGNLFQEDLQLQDLHVSGGQHHTVLCCGGSVYVMGRREYGRLGLGQDLKDEPLEPHKVPALSGAVGVAAGCACSFAVLNSGRAYGWGMNTNQQLGVEGEEEDMWTPKEVGGHKLEQGKVVGVSVGGQHTALLVSFQKKQQPVEAQQLPS